MALYKCLMNRQTCCGNNPCVIDARNHVSRRFPDGCPYGYDISYCKGDKWKKIPQSVVVYDGGKFTIPGWKYPIVVDLGRLAIRGEVPLYCGSTVVGNYQAKIENGKLRLLGDFEPLIADGLFTMCVDITQNTLSHKPFSANGREFIPTVEPIYHVEYARLRSVAVVCHVDVMKEESAKPLPEWCKAGNFCYITSKANMGCQEYGKIKEVNGINIALMNGLGFSIEAIEAGNVAEARLRPWTDEEAAHHVGEAMRIMATGAVLLIVGSDGYGNVWVPACGDNRNIYKGTLQNLMERCERLDGSPCGVLEHLENGEWLR